MKIHFRVLPFLLFLPFALSATNWLVGPAQPHTAPSAVANLVQDGDTVSIQAGVYAGDVAVWKKHNLLLRGIGGYAHLAAAGQNAQGKAIWVIQGSNTRVEYIEFSDCAVPDANGAGIRQEGIGLWVSHCYFHDNQEGILAGNNTDSDIVVEYSEFDHNGAGDGYSHNIYINHVRSFTLRFCYMHRAVVGHNVKTRAQNSYILYNRIMDESDGNSSYLVDIPNGGRAYMIGNVLHQGVHAENATVVDFGLEGYNNPEKVFFAINNTLVNERSGGVSFFKIATGADTVQLQNNLYSGQGTFMSYFGIAYLVQNQYGPPSDFVDPTNYDYHLVTGASAVDAGVAAGDSSLAATYEYVHPLNSAPRVVSGGAIDLGAFELQQSSETQEIWGKNPVLEVYPNPVREACTLRLRTGLSQQLPAWVCNSAGRWVWAGHLTFVDGLANLSLPSLPPGLYLLHCEAGVVPIVLQ